MELIFLLVILVIYTQCILCFNHKDYCCNLIMSCRITFRWLGQSQNDTSIELNLSKAISKAMRLNSQIIISRVHTSIEDSNDDGIMIAIMDIYSPILELDEANNQFQLVKYQLISSFFNYHIQTILEHQKLYLDIPKSSLLIDDSFEIEEYHFYGNTTNTSIETSGFEVVLLGDWGKGGLIGDITRKSIQEKEKEKKIEYTYQAAIARAINRYIVNNEDNVKSIFALGDNFYTNGVKSTTDSQWNTSWISVYKGPAMTIPWYSVLGNHDYGYGSVGVQAQLSMNYVIGNTSIWNLPSQNYSKHFILNETDDYGNLASLFVVFIDTTTLAPSENSCCNSKGGVSEDIQQQRITSQLKHIEEELIVATTIIHPTWIVICGHYPVFSSGDHGDIKELELYLWPLMEKYKVHAYISGHDHISSHLQMNKIHYFIAGAGSMTDKLGKTSSKANLVWSGVSYSAFGLMQVTADFLKISFIDIYDIEVYHTVLWNPYDERTYQQGQVTDEIKNDSSSTLSLFDTLAWIAILKNSTSWIPITVVVFIFLVITAFRNRKPKTTLQEEQHEMLTENDSLHTEQLPMHHKTSREYFELEIEIDHETEQYHSIV